MQKGGSFLTEQVTTDAIFTPEDFTEEHQMIAEMTSEFVQKKYYLIWRRWKITNLQ